MGTGKSKEAEEEPDVPTGATSCQQQEHQYSKVYKCDTPICKTLACRACSQVQPDGTRLCLPCVVNL